jgi:hypothetical protein
MPRQSLGQIAWHGGVEPKRAPLLGFAESLIEGIAGPAQAEDRVTLATGRQSFAKASYVDINRSIGDVDGWPPNALQKMLPRKDAPGRSSKHSSSRNSVGLGWTSRKPRRTLRV